METVFDKFVVMDKEGLKLTKNSKGYNWEIKICSEKISDEDLKRLDEINEKLKTIYGDGE